MRLSVWIVLGWLATAFATSLSSRFPVGHLVPQWSVIVVIFLALRRDAISLLLVSLALGCFDGAHALAPAGSHPLALSVMGLVASWLVGPLVARGAVFFTVLTFGGTICYHVLLSLLVSWFDGRVGFASAWNASLLPAAGLTAVVALLLMVPMEHLDRFLATERREDLSWR